MPDNRNTEFAWNYHNATKHSYASVRANAHSLDFANQPLPFKVYATIDPSPLPRDMRQTGVAALSAIAESIPARTDVKPDLEAVAQLLYLSAGITRHRKYPGGEIYFRAAACTGALYEVELYLVCGDLTGLSAGVYHFAAAEFALRQLRGGDYRSLLVEATGSEPAIAHAPLTIICTCTYWRNAWKYQARTYRHFGWDNGTLLANLLAVATALGLPSKVVCGFVDETLNRLLDVDFQREVAFSLVTLGYNSRPASEAPPGSAEIARLGLETIPLSRQEIDYPIMREMHAASSLHAPQEVVAWRKGSELASLPPMRESSSVFVSPGNVPPDNGLTSNIPAESVIPVQPLSDAEMPRDPIEQVILRRGSSRKFARTSITLSQLSTILHQATRGVPADFLNPTRSQLNNLYLIAHSVEGLAPGAYFFHRDREVLECLKQGDFRTQAGYLGLEQALPADAAADIFFLADLRSILERMGNRGYRAVQLEAGIIGGRLYLAAYAQRLGATGLTFYDDDVTRFFCPHAEGKSAIFLVALGNSAKHNG